MSHHFSIIPQIGSIGNEFTIKINWDFAAALALTDGFRCLPEPAHQMA